MFRLLRLTFLLLIVMALVTLAYIFGNRVQFVERYLSKELHQNVTIGQIHIGFNKIEIENLRIENPKDGKLLASLEIKNISLNVPLMSLFAQVKKVEMLTLNDVTLYIDLFNAAGNQNNWVQLLNNLPNKNESSTYILDEVRINNLQFYIQRVNGKTFTLAPIPKLSFSNLGSKKPLAIWQVARALFESLLSMVTNKIYLTEILRKSEPIKQNLLEGAKRYLPTDEGKPFYQEAVESFKKHSHDTNQFLKNFFYGKPTEE